MILSAFQNSVVEWLDETLGPEEVENTQNRAARFLEEALELAQAAGILDNTVALLVHHVYSRPKGTPQDEVGGCLTTLAALATALEVELDDAATATLKKAWQPEVMARVRMKHQHMLATGSLIPPEDRG